MNYCEALNKFREVFEKNLGQGSDRELLLSYVVNYMSREGTNNPESTYILFLYLSRLDTGSMNSTVLLYSIVYKDHDDIKVRKEAER